MPKDPYKYFRIEARELVESLSTDVMSIEREGATKDVVTRALRHMHTLKGASRVVKEVSIADAAHAMEELLAPFRDAKPPAGRLQSLSNELLALIDAVTTRLATLEPGAIATETTHTQVAKTPTPAPEQFDTVRVELDEMDRLLGGVSEAAVQLASLRHESATVDRARQISSALGVELSTLDSSRTHLRLRALAEELRTCLDQHERRLANGVGRVEVELTQVRDAANRLRLLPASTIFPSLERAARDAAQVLGKQVELVTQGGDGRLDGHVLSALSTALLHLVRNAVAHGIEPPAQRVAADKPKLGRITLTVERRGQRVAFICRDDGAGIDVAALRAVAIARGLAKASDGPLDLAALTPLILNGGVSTTRAANALSGRGVGLDVVRDTAASLKGEVHIGSEPGRGVTVEISVPISLSALRILEVDAAGTVASLPLDSVVATLRLSDHEIARTADRESIAYEGKLIPFLPLERVLGLKGSRRVQAWSAVVIEGQRGLAALGVDRLLRTTEVVVRRLPSQATAVAVIAGASLDAEGNPQLVLDPECVVDAAQNASSPIDAPVVPRLPVLIIDDSLTTRMLEQTILESAGYTVETATSAEEGFDKALASPHCLFLVDVEMPGMDGFEFVTRTQADLRLRQVPAILVTSRNADEDRRRGLAVGAKAYIVKGEFDQGKLLETIRRLVGS